MKLKKIISVVSAFAMAASMFTVANAASLGGKPTVTATFAGYEIDTEYDNQIVARINFKVDASAAESLAAYASTGKGSSKVETGNGITTLGVSWSVDVENSEYWDDFDVDPLTLNGTGTAVAFGPKTSTSEYLVDEVIEWSVRYAVYDNNASGSVSILEATLDGKSTTDKAVWGYSSLADTFDIQGCSIPSYNEWSKPAAAKLAVSAEDTTPANANGYIWDVTVTKGEGGALAAFDALFTDKDGNTAERTIRKGLETLNGKLTATDGNGSVVFKVGLKTEREISSAKFTVTDVADATATWPAAN